MEISVENTTLHVSDDLHKFKISAMVRAKDPDNLRRTIGHVVGYTLSIHNEVIVVVRWAYKHDGRMSIQQVYEEDYPIHPGNIELVFPE